MWFYIFISLILVIPTYVIIVYMRVKDSRRKQISFYYELIFDLTSLWSITEDLLTWRNKLTTVQERKNDVAIITGGGRGIGLEISRGLLKHGLDIIIGVRNVEKMKNVEEQLRKEFPDGKITILKLDVSSMKSVREFAKIVTEKHEKIQLLVNNAGILFGEYKITEDGFENQLATNYIGHFLLTHLLMENLKRAGAEGPYFSRIVNVSSATHNGAKIFLNDINMKKYYYPTTGYCHSKLAQLMSSHILNMMMKINQVPVRSYCVHPGIVASGMFDEVSGKWNPLQFIIKNSAKGAVVALYACLSPNLEGKSEQTIYTNCTKGISSEYSKDRRIQKRLFSLTLDMLKLEKFGDMDRLT